MVNFTSTHQPHNALHNATHTRLTTLCPGLPWWAGIRKVYLDFTEARDSEWQCYKHSNKQRQRSHYHRLERPVFIFHMSCQCDITCICFAPCCSTAAAEHRPCSNHAVSPVHQVHSSIPQQQCTNDGTDGCIDPAPHTMQAVWIINAGRLQIYWLLVTNGQMQQTAATYDNVVCYLNITEMETKNKRNWTHQKYRSRFARCFRGLFFVRGFCSGMSTGRQGTGL